VGRAKKIIADEAGLPAAEPKPTRGRWSRTNVRQLDRKTWIDAGLEVLAADGVAAVRVEVLAKRLQVTKGSFYWHFSDRQELLQAMLAEWRRSTLVAVVESIWGKPTTPRQKLDRLWRICFSGRIDNPGGQLESALRQWALADREVAKLMGEVDAERIAFIARIYRELAVDDPDGYARLFYSYVVGRNTVGTRLQHLPDPRLEPTVRATLRLAEPG
jgi:AcrR family transcriptional regulator